MKPQLTERSDGKLLAEWDPTPSQRMYYVYVLQHTVTHELYYGYTNDIQRRLQDHQRDGCWELAYYEAYRAESDARVRERRLKHHAQALTALKERCHESLQ